MRRPAVGPRVADVEQFANVTLEQGSNLLVLKVINETRDWSACVRLTDGRGKPVANIKVRLTPP